MARRRALGVLPWWGSVLVGAITYALLAFVAPIYFSGNRFAAAIATVAKGYAPFVAGIFLSIGCVGFVRMYFIKRRFNSLESIDQIRHLSWREFESIVGEAFRRRGYEVRENAVGGPDDGIDLVLRKDGAKFFVQCKQWKQTKVGVKPIRELYGVIAAGEAAGGFFVASGEYTEAARDFTRTCAIELIDGAMLAEMIAKAREPEPSMDPTNRKRIEVAIESSVEKFACPTCGAAMVRRTARRGAHAGGAFWGCSAYPRCRGTRPG